MSAIIVIIHCHSLYHKRNVSETKHISFIRTIIRTSSSAQLPRLDPAKCPNSDGTSPPHYI
jgi:hypothetical protein